MRLVSKLLFICFALSIVMQPLLAQNSNSALQKPNHEKVYQVVDSLNEAAFVAKRNSIDSAVDLLKKASKLAQTYNYKKGLATNYFYEAGIYNQFGYSKKAVALYYKALQLSTEAGDVYNIARVNQQLATVLFEAGNFTEAERLLKTAMQSYSSLSRVDDSVNILNSLGLLKLKQNKTDKAISFFNSALKTSKQIGYTYGLKKAYYNLGLVYLEKEQLPKAKSFFVAALELDKGRGDSYGMSLAEVKLAEIALTDHAYKTAITWSQAALEHARLVSASDLEVASIQKIITIYLSQAKLEEVVKWQNELIEIQNQVHKNEKDLALNFLELLKAKNDEHLFHENQKIEAQQKAEIIYLILSLVSLGLFLISIMAYLWFKNYKKTKLYSLELVTKNKEIRKNASKLAALNKTILLQNRALEESSVMKDTLFSIVSHDLRSPLGSVKGVLSFMQRKVMSEAEIRDIISLLNNEIDVVMEMLNNLLDWSKAQLKGSQVDMEPIWLYELVEDNIRIVETQARLKNITIENKLPIDACVTADKERLKFILRNLLANAVKFTFEGGLIAVCAKEEHNNFILSVTDNGQGITEEALSKLFDNEGRYTTIGTAKEKGTGLGLKLSKDFVQSIGGDIWVESKVHHGSTFYISLPKQIEAQVLSFA